MRAPLLVGLLLLLTGCGAPDKPLDLGFKEVPSDVVLGAQSTPTPTPTTSTGVIPLVPLPPPPSVVSLPPPPFEIPPTGPAQPPPVVPTAPACPPLDPLAAPALEAPASVSKPPVQAAYVFANAGSFSVSGADARKGSFPARTLRIVNSIKVSPGSFTFDVAERIGDVTTTTTYLVVTRVTLPTDQPGIYLQHLRYVRTDGTTASFAPATPPRLAAFPLVRGATSDERGVDPQTQTAMTFTTTVEGKARVPACGEPLDTWTIHLSKGTLVSPTQNLQFDATYQLGTQFGGLIVSDSVAFTGDDGSSGVQRSNRATITSVPKAP